MSVYIYTYNVCLCVLLFVINDIIYIYIHNLHTIFPHLAQKNKEVVWHRIPKVDQGLTPLSPLGPGHVAID